MRMTALLHALQEGTESAGGNAIPLLFAEARSAKKWERIRTSPFYAEQVREVREAHDQWRGEPLPVLPFSLYKQFDTTGERKAFERVYFHRRLRLNTFAVLSLLEQDPVYPEALEDVIWAVCDEYTWCLPAHLGGASLHPNRSGEHRRTVDLFAAETAFTLCEITHLLEERLNGAVVSRVRREVRERVLEPFCALSPSYWWETTDMNWAAVCGGSVGAAAMYLIRDDRTLAPILHRVLETMRAFLDGFPEDGACLEGIGYWNYGFGFFVYFASLLKQRTAGRIDLMRDRHVRNIAQFQQKSYLDGVHTVSYSDAPSTYRYNLGLTHFLHSVFADVEIPDASGATGLHDNDGCCRWAPYIRNLGMDG